MRLLGYIKMRFGRARHRTRLPTDAHENGSGTAIKARLIRQRTLDRLGHSEMQMSSTPLARKLDAENSSKGVAVTSAAGRKCSQAPREARPRLSPGEQTTRRTDDECLARLAACNQRRRHAPGGGD